MPVMTVEHNPVASFGIFDAEVSLIAETPDAIGPWTGAGDTPTNFLIARSQALKVYFKWRAGGTIPLLTSVEYTLRVYLERAGQFEQINPNPVVFIASAHSSVAPVNYNAAPPVTLGANLQPGVYSMMATITTRALPTGGSPVNLAVAGFVDLGSFQVYQD